MKRALHIYILLTTWLAMAGIGGFLSAGAQSSYSPETVQDDPIAAALDSLNSLNLFEKGYAKIDYPKNSKYHFAPDSVPRYDVITGEEGRRSIPGSKNCQVNEVTFFHQENR